MCVGNKDYVGSNLILSNVTLLTNVDWDDILKQNTDKEMYLCTYGKPDVEIMGEAARCIKKGRIIIGTGQHSDKWHIEEECPNVKVKRNSHAKMLLIAPNEVYLSSQNIEYKDWYQTTVHIKDKKAYDYYLNLFNCEWSMEGISDWTYNSGTDIVTTEDNIKALDKDFPPFGKISADSKPMFLDKCSCEMVASQDWKKIVTGVENSSVIITTNTLPNPKYVCDCLNILLGNNNRITLVANQNESKKTALIDKLRERYQKYPNINIYGCPNIHSKMLLHSGNNVWLSSHNFGDSGCFESAIQIIDSRAYDFYYRELTEFLRWNIV